MSERSYDPSSNYPLPMAMIEDEEVSNGSNDDLDPRLLATI